MQKVRIQKNNIYYINLFVQLGILLSYKHYWGQQTLYIEQKLREGQRVIPTEITRDWMYSSMHS
jgi:hypothetical protein